MSEQVPDVLVPIGDDRPCNSGQHKQHDDDQRDGCKEDTQLNLGDNTQKGDSDEIPETSCDGRSDVVLNTLSGSVVADWDGQTYLDQDRIFGTKSLART